VSVHQSEGVAAANTTFSLFSRPTQRRYWGHGDETIDVAQPLLPLPSNILEEGKHPAGLAGSRLSSSISSGIVHVVIIADTNKLAGRESAQLPTILPCSL
jgi:hypothetical protein